MTRVTLVPKEGAGELNLISTVVKKYKQGDVEERLYQRPNGLKLVACFASPQTLAAGYRPTDTKLAHLDIDHDDGNPTTTDALEEGWKKVREEFAKYHSLHE